MVSKALVAASTKPMILAILKRGENYGYRIIQSVREVSGGEMEWSEPMLYPVLQRLERDGLVNSQWKTTERGRFRKYYRLTPEGEAELGQDLAQWKAVDSAFHRLLDPAFELA
ncbi:MAG: helix-turn-helix transcriptional regulator [Candidatus Aminicenantes bacterium]|nr:helix-turn-helix transcriptional regulator [Candidatus Aminicenantes bacterium]